MRPKHVDYVILCFPQIMSLEIILRLNTVHSIIVKCAIFHIIIIKHTNVTNRKSNEQESGTYRCLQCDTQYSSNWNLNNHMRDNHEKKQSCKWFRNGDCRFPEDECWNSHDVRSQATAPRNDSEIQCHTCRKTFMNRDVMMNHRKLEHIDKVKPCKDGVNCSRSKCWYKHEINTSSENNPRKEGGDEWVANELDSENSDFQQVPKPPTPPTKQVKGTQSQP